MNNILKIIIAVIFIIGCDRDIDDNSPVYIESEFKPSTGWLLVKNGTLSEIKAAIIDYGGLARNIRPKEFNVELYSQYNGRTAVLFPDGFPTYDLTNFTSWLSAPPGHPNVFDAVSWLTPADARIKYYLRPELENKRGDSLIGVSYQGESVRVYLPDNGLSSITKKLKYRLEPKIKLNGNSEKFTITLDTSTSFGNQEFIINKASDYNGME
jgi:hypothetical protein